MGIKLFCCIMIVSCAALIGLEIRRRLIIRLRSLEYFREYFRSVRSYISHVGMSLEDIASEMDRNTQYSEFSLTLRGKMQHSYFADAFSESLEITSKSLCLTDEDLSMLSSLAGKIGSSDIDGALERLHLADEQFSAMIESARAKLETDGKLYTILALSVGAVTVLLLL